MWMPRWISDNTWISGNTSKDRIWNVSSHRKLVVVSIDDKLKENRFRWFGRVQSRPLDAAVQGAIDI